MISVATVVVAAMWLAADAAGAERAARPGGGVVMLRLGGVDAGLLQDAQGGSPVGQVVVERPGPDGIPGKHLGGVKYEDITITGGAGLGRPFWDWLQQTLDGRGARQRGELLETDFDFKETSAVSFEDALITEVTFPALDAASKEMAVLTVKLAPDLTRRRPGSGVAVAGGGRPGVKQKAWSAANFRLLLDGLPTQRVSRVDAFTIKQAVRSDPIGVQRDPQIEPGALEFPNLAVTVAAQDAGAFYDWLDDFVVKGQNGAAQERAGTLQLLGPDLKPLFGVSLERVGIIRISSQPQETGGRIRVELYVERMRLLPPE
jgi:hypothetical protein